MLCYDLPMTMILSKEAIRVQMAIMGIDTIEELCRRAGITSPTLRAAFAGKPFRSSTVNAIAKALDINPLSLLTIADYVNEENKVA